MSQRKLNWLNTSFLAFSHLLALSAILYMVFVHFSWWSLGLALFWGVCCGLAVTGGYHRLFAHPTYRAAWPVKLFYLLFGAASVQNSALKWSADHREHHAETDHESDPYNAQKGFWWSHIGWVLYESNEHDLGMSRVKDLLADKMVVFQDRHYVALAILMAGVVPLALGFLWGDPIGALLCAGFLRLVVQWHATFCVNSLAHQMGSQPYSTSTSARDSWVTALVTFGEGYHNYHHRFQGDYRNGVRWYHFDPTKWFVWSLSKIGLTWDLRKISWSAIDRARAATKEEKKQGINRLEIDLAKRAEAQRKQSSS
ncbi:MAG: fatty acid desaturase [Planctomycetota bacterium]